MIMSEKISFEVEAYRINFEVSTASWLTNYFKELVNVLKGECV